MPSYPSRVLRSIRLLAVSLCAAAACGPAAGRPIRDGDHATQRDAAAAEPSESRSHEQPLVLQAVDPVGTVRDVPTMTAHCERHLALAARIVARIKERARAEPQGLTFSSTLGELDLALWSLSNGAEYAYLLGVAHPDENLREAARVCETRAEEATTSLWLDAELASVVQQYHDGRTRAGKGSQSSPLEPLSIERERFLAKSLREFQRRGALLGPHAHERLQRIDRELTDLAQQFVAAISAIEPRIRVRPAALAGLPEPYITAHPPEGDGLVTITTRYPDYYPFLTYADDRRLAARLYARFTNRGGEANIARVERMLLLRYEKAQLLGYPTWADYVVEPRMAQRVATIRQFIERLRRALQPRFAAELSELRAAHVRLGGDRHSPIPASERYYLAEQARRHSLGFDTSELAEYFEIRAVTAGLLELTAAMFDLQYVPLRSRTWHRDVLGYEVRERGALLGRIYLDLHARPGKYEHSAMFAICHRRHLPDGSLQTPEAAVVANFSEPGEPMAHSQVVTYFHEFSHLLHHLLTEAELASFAGTQTVRDFVEIPSQVFEQWAWSPEVLDRFARHRTSGARIPAQLFDGMARARHLGLSLAVQHQLFLATVDLELHSRRAGFDTTALVRELRSRHSSFTPVPGTHMQSSFGHFIGYDAAYYSYPWAWVLARDLYSRFEQAGLLDRATARDWRRLILAPGGGADERTMMSRFLGRQPTESAFIRFVTAAP